MVFWRLFGICLSTACLYIQSASKDWTVAKLEELKHTIIAQNFACMTSLTCHTAWSFKAQLRRLNRPSRYNLIIQGEGSNCTSRPYARWLLSWLRPKGNTLYKFVVFWHGISQYSSISQFLAVYFRLFGFAKPNQVGLPVKATRDRLNHHNVEKAWCWDLGLQWSMILKWNMVQNC